MKNYDFDVIVDRQKTDSLKWSKSHLKENFNHEDCLPMWIADMDFVVAEPIREAIIKRAEHGIFGYGYKSLTYLESVVNWQLKRNNWKIEEEWIQFTPGIIPALNFIVQSFCNAGDKVIIQSPVYYPFVNIIESNGCHVSNNALIYENNQYSINFDELERLASDPKTKLMFLCSPHNPVGRVWTKEELVRIGEICIKHNVMIVADEIHSDLIFEPNVHIPFASISNQFAQNSIVCTSPSKTFNLAGLHISNIIVANEKIRTELGHRLAAIDIDPGSFATVALIAAYNEGEEWLKQLMNYLEGNLTYIREFLNKRDIGIKLVEPEGTYLAWLDLSELKYSPLEMQERICNISKLALDDGYIFGRGGESFQRINFACPRNILEEAMERFVSAFE